MVFGQTYTERSHVFVLWLRVKCAYIPTSIWSCWSVLFSVPKNSKICAGSRILFCNKMNPYPFMVTHFSFFLSVSFNSFCGLLFECSFMPIRPFQFFIKYKNVTRNVLPSKWQLRWRCDEMHCLWRTQEMRAIEGLRNQGWLLPPYYQNNWAKWVCGQCKKAAPFAF